MAGPMGYRNYRGRTPKWKAALAVVLVLVILAAIAVIALQRRIVYDETGTPHLPLPWQEKPEGSGDLGEVDITIQMPERQEEITAFSVPVGVLTQEGWKNAVESAALATERAYNAAAVTVKDSTGRVYFDSSAAVSGSVSIAGDTGAALAEIAGEESSFYTIARLSCFHDPKAAGSDVEGMGLKNTGGYIFYDGNNSQWLDPGKPAARRYLCGLAKEAAALGFDEIMLTDVSYPTEGKLDKIDYGGTPQEENLAVFLEEMRAALEPYSVALSIEVPETAVEEGGSAAGLRLAEIAPQVDRVYAVAAPEQAETLAAAVAAASSSTMFIPELEADDPAFAGSHLLLK